MSGNPNSTPAPAERRQNGGAGGSVRRARERAEAELLGRSKAESEPVVAPRSVNTRPQEKSRGPVAQVRRQGPVISSPSPRGNPATIGSSISRPSPAAQNPNWPLRDDTSPVQAPGGSRPPPRGPPPQRPPRPRNVPSLLDSSKVQDYTPTFQYRKPPPPPTVARIQNVNDRDSSNYGDDDDFKSPPNSSSTPRTPNSADRMSSDRPSTSSSMGTIPDFPVPAVPTPAPAPVPAPAPALAPPPQALQGRRPGPPPVSRGRGASSFYSQSSFVSPIPEEMPEQYARGGGSYASSKAIPSSWGSQPEGYDPEPLQPQIEEEDEDRGPSASKRGNPAVLVRQASLGQKAKPALTTIRSSEDTRKLDGGKGGAIARAAAGAGAVGAAAAASGLSQGRNPAPKASQIGGPGQNAREVQRLPTSPTFSSSSSGSSEPDLEKPPIANEEEVPLGRSASVLSDMRANPGMSEKLPASRRPPRLNIDAVKEAESRGSLTSLPDLIRRATRLASNLDRGKTASKLGMLDILASENRLKNGSSPNRQRHSQGSMSDILSAFPPPGVATPTGGRTSPWPAVYSPSRLNQQSAPYETTRSRPDRSQKGGRRCCGMPMWAFILLAIVLLLLVAAAVVIPVVLIVLPRQRNSPTPQPGSASDLNNCPNSAPCQNGGVSVVSNNACRCVCTNGFTGQSCTLSSDASCISTDVADSDASNPFRNATLGNAMPRLLTGASQNFSIPLNTSQLLSLFSTNNMSCTSENALVTLNGQIAKSKRFYMLPTEDSTGFGADDRQSTDRSKVQNSPDPIMKSSDGFRSPLPTETSAETFVEPLLEAQEAKILALPDDTHPDAARITGQVNMGSLLDRRQATLTSNGIVYAASSAPAAASSTPTYEQTSNSVSPASTASASAASSSSAPVGPNFQLTQDVLDFARIAVLFIFQKTSALSAAINTQEKLQDFFSGTLTNTTMGMNTTPENFIINFSNFSIVSSDGTSVGGRGDGSGQVSIH